MLNSTLQEIHEILGTPVGVVGLLFKTFLTFDCLDLIPARTKQINTVEALLATTLVSDQLKVRPPS